VKKICDTLLGDGHRVGSETLSNRTRFGDVTVAIRRLEWRLSVTIMGTKK
jgi:hypothetical protein